MTDTPFIKFYPSDFLGGTSGLSPAERGVYITLLCLIYENNGPIARDDSRLSRRCGAPKAAFQKALSSLMDEGKMVEANGMLTNSRAEKALMDRSNRTQNSTHAAHQRWSAQKGKTQQNQRADDAGAVPPQCASDASQKPDPDREDTNVSSRRSGSPDDGFDAFWTLWPSKKNKDAARKAWRRLSMDSRRAAYVAIRDGWFERWRQGSPDANPIHAATFLNKKRWEDEAETPQLRTINGGRYEQGTYHTQSNANRPQDRPDPALEQIARLAGLGQTPGDSGG